MKLKISAILLGLLCLTCVCAGQIVPDYALRNLDTTVVYDPVEEALNGKEYRGMIHDSIDALYEAGKDEEGFAQLWRWKAELEQAGDTIGLDYPVILVDLSVALFNAGNSRKALPLLQRVVENQHLPGVWRDWMQREAAQFMALVQIMLSDFEAAGNARDLAAERNAYGNSKIGDLEFEEHETFGNVVFDSLHHTIAIREHKKALVALDMMLGIRRNERMARMREFVAVSMRFHELWLEAAHGTPIEALEMESLLGKVEKLELRQGLAFAVYFQAVECLVSGKDYCGALDMMTRIRSRLKEYVNAPGQIHFQMIGYYAMQFANMESDIYRYLGDPIQSLKAQRGFHAFYRELMHNSPDVEAREPSVQVLGLAYLSFSLNEIRALVHPKVGRYAEAMRAAQQFVEDFRVMAGSRSFGDDHAMWISEHSIPMLQEEMVAVAQTFHHGDPRFKEMVLGQGLLWMEEFKGRRLQAHWEESLALDGDQLPENIRDEVAAIRRELTLLNSQLRAGTTKPVETRMRITQLEAKEERLMSAHSPRWMGGEVIPEVGVHAALPLLRQQLADDEGIVCYFEGFSYLFRFTITRQEARLDQLQIPGWAGENCRDVGRYERQISEFGSPFLPTERYKTLSDSLAAWLWPWKSPQDAPSRVSVFPDGRLWGLPWDALTYASKQANYQGFNYFLRHHSISLWPGIKQWWVSRTARQSSARGGFYSFCPGFLEKSACESDTILAQYAPLGRINSAHSAVREQYFGEFYQGQSASEATFKQHLGHAAVLSIATHAVMDSLDHQLNHLALYPDCSDSVDDGKVHSYELLRQSIHAELVMLWGCSTGKGKLMKGEGLLSLARAFLASGARSVLMSQWDMGEMATAKMMPLYFRHLANGLGKAEALRQAKLEFLQTAGPLEADPHQWAGWALIGDDHHLETTLRAESRRPWNWALVASSGLSLIFAVNLLRKRRKRTK
ncbi:MAG: CHAT domain-containing protein [Bacteroidia bacterium]